MKNIVTFRNKAVIITHNGKEVSQYEGDNSLIQILKPEFGKKITVPFGESIKKKDRITYTEYLKEFEPGDVGYVQAILLDKIQNELLMTVA